MDSAPRIGLEQFELYGLGLRGLEYITAFNNDTISTSESTETANYDSIIINV